jgi:chromosome partitioning protein
MMTHVVTFANGKGGTGKTTSVMLGAGILTKRGESVAVLDMDPSGGATEWAYKAEASGNPMPFEVRSANIKELQRVRQGGTDWVFIDTPPLQAEIIQAAMDAADLVVLPTQPSDLDLARALETIRSIDLTTFAVLATRVNPQTRQWRDFNKRLDDEKIGRLDAWINAREDIKRAVGTPSIPHDTGYPEAINEIVELFSNGKDQQ